MTNKIGFIGVGAMGGPIAARMVEHGISILAYDPNPENLATAISKGCTAASSNRTVTSEQHCSTVTNSSTSSGSSTAVIPKPPISVAPA